MLRKNAARMLFGIAFLALALLLLGQVAGWWGAINFSGWWTVFLIVPGIAMMITTGLHFWNVFLVLLGIYLLARKQEWIDELPREYVGIAVLVFVGLWLICGAFSHKRRTSENVHTTEFRTDAVVDDEDYIQHTSIFGEVHARSEHKSLRGGKLTSVFGSIELDLRQAQIADGAVFEMVSIFGGIDVLAPAGCRVVAQGVPIFGGMDNRIPQQEAAFPRMTVRYTVVFGGIEIK